MREGKLRQLGHGLYFHPKKSRFGVVPPSDDELMRAFLGGAPFVFTGPERWNALGLGSTAMHAVTTVYNTKQTGTVELGGRRFALRRVAFPEQPVAEWFVVDLLEHATEVGVARVEVQERLGRAVASGRLDAGRLAEMGARFGSHATRAVLRSVLTGGTDPAPR